MFLPRAIHTIVAIIHNHEELLLNLSKELIIDGSEQRTVKQSGNNLPKTPGIQSAKN
jgi:hypothetical protein